MPGAGAARVKKEPEPPKQGGSATLGSGSATLVPGSRNVLGSRLKSMQCKASGKLKRSEAQHFFSVSFPLAKCLDDMLHSEGCAGEERAGGLLLQEAAQAALGEPIHILARI